MKALVVGGARSGKYIALLLNENNYEVTLTDLTTVTYKEELQAKGITVVDGSHPDSLLDTDYDLVIKNPGIKYTSPFIVKLMDKGYKIYNEIEIALRYAPQVKPLVVTGTNGKTTTVSLLNEMMQTTFKHSYVAGNIGKAVSEVIYEHRDIKELVIEISSFQLDGTYDFHPYIANITNLQPDHLDYYDSESDYYKSKQKVYTNQTESDYLIINKDDDTIQKYLNHPKSKIITYSLYADADVMLIDDNIMYNDVKLFNVKDMSLVGKHNVYNAIVASIMAYLKGVSLEDIQKVLKTFKGVEHRIEFVKEEHGVKFYNDSKATNIESLKVALEAFNRPVILLAGGYDKKISFDDLKEYQKDVKEAILFGETKHLLAEVFENHIIVETLEEAVKVSKDLAESNDIVLFSPACASFDQFKDYEERGRLFKQYVNNN